VTTDKVLDKLAKLKAMAEGEAKLGNSAAAEAFASMINAMLLKHELSMEDIPVPGAPEEPIVEVSVGRDAHGIPRSRSRVAWQEALAHVVAPAHLCKFLVTSGSNRITFVGTRSNATVCEYAYGVLAAAADRMSVEARDKYWREHRNDPDFRSGNFRAAWLMGFILRIGERFAEARRREVEATGNTSTALIRLDQALVRAKGYVDERYKRKVSGTTWRGGISVGHQAGRAAADRVQINKGLEQKQRSLK
jgi:hypothetical protein